MFDVLPESQGRRFFVKASGKLTDADYRDLLPRLETAIAGFGPLRMFIDMEDFRGIELQAAWDDFAFGVKHWNDFERVAIIGDKRGEELSAKAFDLITEVDIRYFDIAERGRARAWIEDA